MGNSTTNKVIGEGTIQFHSHDGCITTLQSIRHVAESRYNLSLGPLHEKRFNFSSEGDLMKVFKDAHVKFQAERVSNVNTLRNSEVTVGGLQLDQRLWNIRDYDIFDLRCSVLP